MLTDVNSLRFRKELSVSWEQGFTYNKAGVYKGWVIKGEGCHGGYDGRGGACHLAEQALSHINSSRTIGLRWGLKLKIFYVAKNYP